MVDLYDWSELAEEGWSTLLLGNGMSINVSSDFDYRSLYGEAKKRELLGPRDEAVFELYETGNFEVALSKLRETILIAEAFKERTGRYKSCFRSIQETLGHTIQGVHLKEREVPAATLDAIQDAFLKHDKIFTTSYDLLAYWAMGRQGGYRFFCDFFWGGREANEFDPDDCEAWDGRTPIYYLHGALHLIVSGEGITRKVNKRDLREGEEEILELFDSEVPDDPEARPLLVTEGSSSDKLQKIERNAYLCHAYEALEDDDGSLLVFGHSLGKQDQHLIEAIRAQPDRPVAISMLPGKDQLDLEERQVRIRKRLGMPHVYFYDASSHPLGDPDLRAPEAGRRRAGAFRRG
jgi:hypothetical protein